jgi:hypothetical protein
VIVIEHLQGFRCVTYDAALAGVYIEWNEKLSTNWYRTHKEGRSDKDPSEFWYEGEIGFFDFIYHSPGDETKLQWSLWCLGVTST